jgi:hypothetical protein
MILTIRGPRLSEPTENLHFPYNSEDPERRKDTIRRVSRANEIKGIANYFASQRPNSDRGRGKLL